VLSCDQVEELINLRTRLGNSAGGVPPCAPRPSNIQDVVSSHSPLSAQTGEGDIKTYQMKSQATPAAPREEAARGEGLTAEDIDRVRQAVIARLAGKP